MPEPAHTLLPKCFNPQAVTEHPLAFAGELPADSMTRLREAVISIGSPVTVDLHLAHTGSGCRMEGKIACTLGLRCVRCLGEVQVRVDPDVRLMVGSIPGGSAKVPEGYDLYEYEGSSLELAQLVEDELLLALPLVPRHVDISHCDQGMVAWLSSKERASGPARNPFAILKRS